MTDSLGDRIKGYENVERRYLTRRTPVIIRVDGRAFHTFTATAKKPFDPDLIFCMRTAATHTAKELGAKVAYIQSDEASFLLTDFDRLETQALFDNNLQKLVSISASTMTSWFQYSWFANPQRNTAIRPIFDARAFNIPKEEVANYFLWRARDWSRNSLQMFARAHFSQAELHGKRHDEIHEMLHQIGKNWTTDCSPHERNGIFINGKDAFNDELHVYPKPEYAEIEAIVAPYLYPGE